ncbi:hypothetical protein PISMIDRAFT_621799 [Pisolithus microcarpus 441]|uniref:Secreted protein n=1 Tax=Pisolithus microcarpus 441 TaxID=765257 RepID=A0A0C9Y4J1_9AGAM|nr:hypothetical protein PISMIDRAFT_621799 [Pisolithus microcarpus 441]
MVSFFSIVYLIHLVSSHRLRCARYSTYYALEVGNAVDIRGGYGSRCDVRLRVVILTILPFPFVSSQTSTTPFLHLSPCGIITLVQMGKKVCFIDYMYGWSFFSRLIPSSYFTSMSFLLVHC